MAQLLQFVQAGFAAPPDDATPAGSGMWRRLPLPATGVAALCADPAAGGLAVVPCDPAAAARSGDVVALLVADASGGPVRHVCLALAPFTSTPMRCPSPAWSCCAPEIASPASSATACGTCSTTRRRPRRSRPITGRPRSSAHGVGRRWHPVRRAWHARRAASCATRTRHARAGARRRRARAAARRPRRPRHRPGCLRA